MASRTGRKRKTKVTLPGQDQRVTVEPADVEDPFEPGKTIRVMKNTQTTPIDHIHARGRLVGEGDSYEDGVARKLAGDRFQRLYEQAEASDAKAIDYSAVKVDVSFQYRGVTEAKVEASKEMVRISQALGATHYDIVRAICGQQMSWFEYVKKRAGAYGGAQGKALYQELREGLDALIWHWGVVQGPERSKVRADRMLVDSVDAA